MPCSTPHDTYRNHRRRTHRIDPRSGTGRPRLRRGDQQLARPRVARAARRRTRREGEGRHRGGCRGLRRRRHRDRAPQGLPGGSGRPARRQDRARHEQLLLGARRPHPRPRREDARPRAGCCRSTCPNRRSPRRSTTSAPRTSSRTESPPGRPDRRALATAGDSAEAVAFVTALYDEFGFDTVERRPARGELARRARSAGVRRAADPRTSSSRTSPRPRADRRAGHFPQG